MTNIKSYGNLDRFRLAAAFMVVAIHISPFGSINKTFDFAITYIVGRIAVPFFFMITGYFVISACIANSFVLLTFLKKMGIYYFLTILLYLPLNFYGGTFEEFKTAGDFVTAILFDGTFYHLWYFPAVILGAFLVSLLGKRIQGMVLLVSTVILYSMGLLGDSYYGLASQIPGVASLFDVIFRISSYTRNGIFFAPIFLVLGMIIAKQKYVMPRNRAIVYFGISITAMLVEGLLLYHYKIQRHTSMYIFLIPCMYFLFQILIGNSQGKRKEKQKLSKAQRESGKQKKNEEKKLRKAAMLIYILHPLVLVAIRGIGKITETTGILVENSLICYLAVCISTFLLARILLFAYDKLHVPVFQKGRAWIEVDIQNLQHNLHILQPYMTKNCEFMPAIKGNGYGHGAIVIAKELNQMGIYQFCVATLEEGKQLRTKGICGEVLILGYTHPQQFGQIKKYDLTQTILDDSYAEQLNHYGKKIKCHLAIDTGMHRLGVAAEDTEGIIRILGMKYLKISGMFTHLCVADSKAEAEVNFTKQQIVSFYHLFDYINQQGVQPLKIHIQNSYGLIHYPNLSCDFARIGILMYGIYSCKEDAPAYSLPLRPVLAIKARVALIRELKRGEGIGYGLTFTAEQDMKIAIITIGYGDGIPRCVGEHNGAVLINGERAKIVGRICMDQITVDVTRIDHVRQGDIAVIIGKSKNQEITVMDIADQAGTITNEIVSRLGTRLATVYK